MQITRGRILSIVVAIGEMVVPVVAWGDFSAIALPLIVWIPLALIWFPEEIEEIFSVLYCMGGSRAGPYEETPAIIISVLGWLILLGMPVWLYSMKK